MILDYLRTYNADICILQETHNENAEDEENWGREWGGKCIWSRGTHRSCGVGILLRPNSETTIVTTKHDNDGRVVSAKLQHKGKELNIINIYAPTTPGERKTFKENLRQYKTGDENLLLGGDFNCVEDLQKDKQGGNPHTGTTGIKEMKDFTERHQLIDIWRHQHQGDRIFTWSTRDFTLRSRLDRWYTQNDRANDIVSDIRACPHSDHAAVEIEIDLAKGQRRGRGVWKLNNTILQDKAFQRGYVHTFWAAKKQQYDDKLEWWDDVKTHFKKVAIRHTIKKVRARTQQENQLENRVTKLQNEPNPDITTIEEIKEQLATIVKDRLDGVKIRSRATWLEHGERPTRYFFALEQTKQKKATINKLKTATGEVTSNPEILSMPRISIPHCTQTKTPIQQHKHGSWDRWTNS